MIDIVSLHDPMLEQDRLGGVDIEATRLACSLSDGKQGDCE